MTFLPGFKQVLTKEMGWINLEDYYKILKKSSESILVVKDGHCQYECPVSFVSTLYNGVLMDIKTSSDRVILKPSTCILNTTAEHLKENDELDKFGKPQIIFNVEKVKWQGQMMCLSFKEHVLLPIKFEHDYILIPI